MPRGEDVAHPVGPGAVDQDEQIAVVDRMRVEWGAVGRAGAPAYVGSAPVECRA
jgi:hypothetical protein